MNQEQGSLNVQEMRDRRIRLLAEAEDSTETAKKIAEDLFTLDLTVYSKNFTFDSILYNAFAQSILDENISMHPEQIRILNEIKSRDAVIISAPTSFGKTFCVFEYIARYEPSNVVLIVPTLALVDEYIKKIIKKYRTNFKSYKVHTQLDSQGAYDFSINNIFILTHDRVVQDELYKMIEKIDLLVVDEVYKLETDSNNDRVLVLNLAYYYLAQVAKKYVLLAPFISSIVDIDKLSKKPYFYNTEYSPVVNDVITLELLNHKDRYPQCQRLLKETIGKEEQTLIYFPTVVGMYKYINECISQEPILDEIDDGVKSFITWAKEEIHEEWSVVKALERGYTIHNGQMPLGIRIYQLNLYENLPQYNRLLCTSTLLEGVNTCAKNIIITKPSRKSNKDTSEDEFSAFDFFNLVGRTGRLNQHFIGTAYYLKAPTDPVYRKIDAIRDIRFELTDDSKDIDIQKGLIEKHEDYLCFLKKIGIEHEDYLKNIGSRFRFDTIKELYNNYCKHRHELISELRKLSIEKNYGRLYLIRVLCWICNGKQDNFKASLINELINKRRQKIKTIVDKTKTFYEKTDINTIISTTIKLKTSEIEHIFYAKINIIKYFMTVEKISSSDIATLDDKVIGAIETIYFSNSKQKKMLLDIGIYERDVDKIISIIGKEFTDTFEMKRRLVEYYSRLEKQISYISKFIIKNLQ